MLKSATFSALLAFTAGTVLAAQDSSRAVDRASDARLMPGDRIFVHILREPLMRDTVTVDERGFAALPKLGSMNVASMSVGALKDSLIVRYSEYLRQPELEIIVLRRVIVNGEVRQPNVYLVDVSSTVADVIARAGGFTDAAKRTKIHVVRQGKRVAVGAWDNGGAIAMELMSGDEIVVSRRSWWVLNALPAVSTAALLYSIIMSTR